MPGSVDLTVFIAAENRKGTFMLTFTPGDDLAPLAEGRDWVFVLDISGSMQGKYATLIEGVKQGLDQLKVGDRFRVILFNDNASDITQGYVDVSPQAVQQVLQSLSQHGPNNGTNLYAGLEKGLKGLDSDRSSAIVLVTDGVANVGNTERKHFMKLLENRDVRLFLLI